jgi:carbamoyltransferase
MNILGVHDGHNASAVLLVDGQVVAGAQEERFRNEKNYFGFPQNAINWILKEHHLSAQDLDFVALASVHQPPAFDTKLIRDVFRKEQEQFVRSRLLGIGRDTPFYQIYRWRLRSERIREFRKAGFEERKLVFVEHHTCHAAASYYGSPWRDRVLVLTLDGGGDRLSATVSIASGSSIERIASTPDTDSVGNIYARVTFMMGFSPWEHEYKIMGMAPYASQSHSATLKRQLDSYLDLSEKTPLTFRRKISEPTRLICRRLETPLRYQRFDQIACALQSFTEELVIRWVRAAISETGIRKVALGGGVFMNVKVNKLIAEIPEVENVFVFPSCGDESNAVGAAYQAYVDQIGSAPTPLGPIYWGPGFGMTEAEDAIKKVAQGNEFDYENIDEIEDAIVGLLLKGKIVARVAGSMEFGARALGNRSILADPSNLENVQIINRMIKMRDFWMPFAPVVMAERQDEYFYRPKPVQSHYMMFAFDTQPARRKEIIAATHQADGTARPQVIEEEYNPSYYAILRGFEKATGRGTLLNTSYNLHGYPISLGPQEALWVFENSGLEYLALGHYLLRKKSK